MSNTNQLAAAIETHNARMDAHADHGIKVHAMYSARAHGKKKQATKAEYEAEWNDFNAENDLLKRLDFRPFRALAAEAGVDFQVIKGWKLAIVEGSIA